MAVPIFTLNSICAEEYAEMSLKDLLGIDVFTSASLLPTQTSKAPGTVYSFYREDFKKFGVRRLDDLLQFVPGLQLNQYRKRHKSIWSRGLLDRYNDKMVLMVDGVRMQHLYYGHFSLGDNFPLERIEKVEIIMGPASSLYGANAFGGIISVTTRDFSEKASVEVTLEAGDHRRKKGSLLYNTSDVQAFGSYLTQDAPFRGDRKSFIGSDVLQPLDENYQTLHIKAKALQGLTLKLDYSESDTPFLFIPPTQDAFIKEESLTLSASYEYGTIDTGRVEVTAYHQDDKSREYEKEQQSQALGYEEYQNATMAGANLTGLKRMDDHVIAIGASWQHEQADNTQYERSFHFREGFLDPTISGDLLSKPNIKNSNYALFVQDVWDINPKLNLTIGGRYDNFEQFDDYFNYRGALVFTPDDRQTWKLMYGTAIRTPSFREYLKVLEGTDFNAPIPDAESIKSLELGYLYQWDEANLNINIFSNTLDDFIREEPTPDSEDEFFNNGSGTLRLMGVESLLHIRPLDRLDLRLGLAYLDAEDDTIGTMPYLATWSSSLNLHYRYFAGHTTGLSFIHNSNRDDSNNFDDEAESFVIANVYASGQISSKLNYTLGIDNLFDENVLDPAADFGGQHNTARSEQEIWLRLEWNPEF